MSGVNDGFVSNVVYGNDFFLSGEYFGGGNFDIEIVMGNYDIVGFFENFGKVVEILFVFNFGNDLNVFVFFVEDFMNVFDVLFFVDESCGKLKN